jgi:integrase
VFPDLSVKKDASGKWAFIIDVTPPGGTRKQVRRRGFPTKTAALDALDELKRELNEDNFVERSDERLGPVLERWVAAQAVVNHRPSTTWGYEKKVKYINSRQVGDLPIQDLRPVHLDSLYHELLVSGGRNGQGLSAKTVREVHGIISRALKDSVRKGLLKRNVAEMADPPRSKATKAPRFNVWTPSELKQFLHHVEGHRMGLMLRLIGVTGLRRARLWACAGATLTWRVAS